MPEDLKTLSLDVGTGELFINGKKLENVSYMQLTFDSGEWDMRLKQYKYFGPSGKAASKDTANITKE